jgi:hypothetical protein
VLRYGLSSKLLSNLGFKIKSYETVDQRLLFTLAPYSGSAFQAFGLDLGLPLMEQPAWRMILENAVDIELDYATKNQHPGFLSESYSGEGVEYTGDVGMPDLAVTQDERVTTAPSLYTLGTAYQIAPEKMEKFLADNWPVISTLLTDHGPWEGYKTDEKRPIEFQTTAHTLSLLLGAMGNGPGNMKRYLEAQNLTGALEKLFQPGLPFDFLQPGIELSTWAGDGASVRVTRNGQKVTVHSESAGLGGVIFKLPVGTSTSLSGGLLELHYTCDRTVKRVTIKLPRSEAAGPDVISNEILTRFVKTGDAGETFSIPLPTSPALHGMKTVEVNFEADADTVPLTLNLTQFSYKPLSR